MSSCCFSLWCIEGIICWDISKIDFFQCDCRTSMQRSEQVLCDSIGLPLNPDWGLWTLGTFWAQAEGRAGIWFPPVQKWADRPGQGHNMAATWQCAMGGRVKALAGSTEGLGYILLFSHLSWLRLNAIWQLEHVHLLTHREKREWKLCLRTTIHGHWKPPVNLCHWKIMCSFEWHSSK